MVLYVYAHLPSCSSQLLLTASNLYRTVVTEILQKELALFNDFVKNTDHQNVAPERDNKTNNTGDDHLRKANGKGMGEEPVLGVTLRLDQKSQRTKALKGVWDRDSTRGRRGKTNKTSAETVDSDMGDETPRTKMPRTPSEETIGETQEKNRDKKMVKIGVICGSKQTTQYRRRIVSMKPFSHTPSFLDPIDSARSPRQCRPLLGNAAKRRVLDTTTGIAETCDRSVVRPPGELLLHGRR